jgi:hypothetical protein
VSGDRDAAAHTRPLTKILNHLIERLTMAAARVIMILMMMMMMRRRRTEKGVLRE